MESGSQQKHVRMGWYGSLSSLFNRCCCILKPDAVADALRAPTSAEHKELLFPLNGTNARLARCRCISMLTFWTSAAEANVCCSSSRATHIERLPWTTHSSVTGQEEYECVIIPHPGNWPFTSCLPTRGQSLRSPPKILLRLALWPLRSQAEVLMFAVNLLWLDHQVEAGD